MKAVFSPPPERTTVRLQQIVAANFEAKGGNQSYSVLGLGTDGSVYRYDPHCEGWIPWPMKIVSCREQHKARR